MLFHLQVPTKSAFIKIGGVIKKIGYSQLCGPNSFAILIRVVEVSSEKRVCTYLPK